MNLVLFLSTGIAMYAVAFVYCDKVKKIEKDGKKSEKKVDIRKNKWYNRIVRKGRDSQPK